MKRKDGNVMNVVRDRLDALRKLMKERGMDAYMIPTADFHESEYVGEHFKCREYMTGFTGSAGTALITMDEACLWVDGRYYVQAAAQLKDSTVTMMKMGQRCPPARDFYGDRTVPFFSRLIRRRRIFPHALTRLCQMWYYI